MARRKVFGALLLVSPSRVQAIPCGLITYSSRTIADLADSRNNNHFRALPKPKDRLGVRTLVPDREFSYLERLRALYEEQINVVIRLKLGSHPQKF
jgi:hypothetical protein